MCKNIGYCGLNCDKCETKIATLKNDDNLRKKVAEKWSKLNNTEIPYEAINCLGCKKGSIKSIFCESICEVRKCALSNKIDSCDKCKDMEKCEKIKPFLMSDINEFKK